MTDREMLELAARAAGIDLTFDDHGNSGFWDQWRGLPQWTPWNPLADDGDALRLAVKLLLVVDLDCWEAVCVGQANWDDDQKCCETLTDNDHCAATRRAIVRAAAEIGRAK